MLEVSIHVFSFSAKSQKLVEDMKQAQTVSASFAKQGVHILHISPRTSSPANNTNARENPTIELANTPLQTSQPILRWQNHMT